MQTRREMLAHSATVAGLLATAGLLPQTALAAWPEAAFQAKTLADAVKALGGSAPAESTATVHAPTSPASQSPRARCSFFGSFEGRNAADAAHTKTNALAAIATASPCI